ncbi:MAG TPA: hypothetical protein VJM32_06470 [Candidatus Saccharimonadales bacterium]|nr:hypothetical protein [Candidatus Saccharimonadales bacterium]
MTRRKKSSTGKKLPANVAKKRPQKQKAAKAATQAAPEVTPEAVVAERAIKIEARRVRRTPEVSAAEALPAPARRSLGLAERLAIVAGGVFLVVGIVGVLQRPDTSVPVTDVKKQNIPMSLDDFKDDPAIQQVIQKQLGEQGTAAPTPQQQQAQSPQTAGGNLQAPANSLQP